MLALRLTVSEPKITQESVLEYFKDEKCCIASEHEDTNHHFHVALQTDSSVDSVRNKMNRFFLPKKNMTYCKVDNGRYSIYTVKCGNIIQNTLYSDSELAEVQAQSYTKKERPKSRTATLVDSFQPEIEEYQDYDFGTCQRLTQSFDDDMFDYFIQNYNGPFGAKHCQEYVFGVMAIHKPLELRKILKKNILH